MAEVMAASAIVGGASEAAKSAGEAAKTVVARAEDVRTRDLPNYDYEKVFWNSTYSVALLGLGFAAVKVGGFFMWIVNALNDNGLTGWAIDDPSVALMNKVGAVMSRVDKWMTAAIPAAPVAIVGAHAAIEYVKKRKFMDKKDRLAGDVVSALAGIMAGAAVWDAVVNDPLFKPTPDPKEKVEDIIEKGGGEFVESYRGFDIYYDGRTDTYYINDPSRKIYGTAVSLKEMKGVIDMILKRLETG